MLNPAANSEKREKHSIMKDLSISRKLSIGFGILLILIALSALLSVFFIKNIDHQVELYGEYTVPNMEHVRSMQVNMQGILHSLLYAILEDDAQSIKADLDAASTHAGKVISSLEAYKNHQRNHDLDDEINNISTILSEAAQIREKINALVLDHSEVNLEEALKLFENEYKPKIDQTMEILFSLSAIAEERAAQQSADAEAAERLSWILLSVSVLISFALTLGVITTLRKAILQPINEIVDAYREISKGNMDIEIKYEARDEMGQMAEFIRNGNRLQTSIIRDVIEKFTRIAQGDLRIKVALDYPGDYRVLKEAILDTAASMNYIMHTIDSAAEQVSIGASQVSFGAQNLAAGSTEQASSIEELSASITQVAEQAGKNSDNVSSATQYVQQASEDIISGNRHMAQLTEAMGKIGSASGQVSSITKTIEDIAFQTNILALNATIEAARAGNAGKGFAVVADEVRNLAAKSVEAARQTGELIKNTIDTVNNGTKITEQTAQVLHALGTGSSQIGDIMVEIRKASSEQASAIEQIQQGLEQVSSVVQTNAATAQENSATSEEMSAQAAMLREEVGKFKLDDLRSHTPTIPLPDTVISLSDNLPRLRKPVLEAASGFGKY